MNVEQFLLYSKSLLIKGIISQTHVPSLRLKWYWTKLLIAQAYFLIKTLRYCKIKEARLVTLLSFLEL